MISVHGLSKAYGRKSALHDVNFEVTAGETVAVLGPNGAGKTTLVEILEGFRTPSAGTVRVLGADPATRQRGWRDRIGVLLQTTSVEPQLTVREAVRMYRDLYSRPRPVDELLELVDLGAVADRRAGTLSGGQQRRLDLALALVGRPDVLFLDEPTTGFDPHARRLTWELLRSLGCTVLLTTHYLDEAAHLADRVVVVAGGRIVAEGDPATLGGHHLATATITYRDTGAEAATVIETDRPTAVLAELTGPAAAAGVELDGLTVSRPTLEDVYLSLIGAVHD
jgi:ABC-2 type transport system ATP-binding protein